MPSQQGGSAYSLDAETWRTAPPILNAPGRPPRPRTHLAPNATTSPKLTKEDFLRQEELTQAMVPAKITDMQNFPAIPLDEWKATKDTLHRWLQIVGKIRLSSTYYRNHWWHVPLYPTATGLTTTLMNAKLLRFEIQLDFQSHRLTVATTGGDRASFALAGLSVADFYDALLRTLAGVDVHAAIDPVPFDLADDTPFPEDHEHAAYDPANAHRYWLVLTQVHKVLDEFAGRFIGKTSPVHHFWHTLDIAVTRFSGRRAPEMAADPVTREAYSHEVASFGFWFGDERYEAPAFYSYTTPKPEGLADTTLEPSPAQWVEQPGDGHLALLPYDDVRSSAGPHDLVLEFYESAYQHGARLAGWPIAELTAPARRRIFR